MLPGGRGMLPGRGMSLGVPRKDPRGAEPFVMLMEADITPHIKAEGAAYKAAPRGRPSRAAPVPGRGKWGPASGLRSGRGKEKGL